MSDAANELHHLSMRYVGAMIEAATGRKVGLLPASHPGLQEMRDLIDLILIVRAEINGLTKILIDKEIATLQECVREFDEQYRWLTQQKARFLGVEVTPNGLKFKVDGASPQN